MLLDLHRYLWIFLAVYDSVLLVQMLFGTVCASKLLFGIPCAACGMTRAFKYFFELKVSKAFSFHPVFPLVIADFVLFLYVRYFNPKKENIFVWASIVLIAVAFAVYFVRMYYLFPSTAPLDYYKDNLFSYILSRKANLGG